MHWRLIVSDALEWIGDRLLALALWLADGALDGIDDFEAELARYRRNVRLRGWLRDGRKVIGE